MLKLTILYARTKPVEIHVPDMGLTTQEWGYAVMAATRYPMARQYGTTGAKEVATALWDQQHQEALVLGVGDAVLVAGQIVRMVDSEIGPTLTPAEPLTVHLGPSMHVSADVAPPDAVAYAEDHRDRLWTGRGLGIWRCLTDPAGHTTPGGWARVWREHGPLTPLVPVERLDEPEGAEWTAPHKDVLPPGRETADAAGPFG